MKFKLYYESMQALNITSANQEDVDPQWSHYQPSVSPFNSAEQYSPSVSYGANMATTSPLSQLLKEMHEMKSQLSTLTLTNQNVNSRTPPSFDKTINPRTGQQWKRYCWSCGCCPHWSKNCPTKKKGHQNEATFQNRMGGSNVNCK